MQSLVRRAVELAKTDGEFRIAAREWTGTLRIVVDEETHVVKMEAGRAASVATDDAGDAPIPGEVVLAGSAAVWEQMLVAVPRPFYQDIQGGRTIASAQQRQNRQPSSYTTTCMSGGRGAVVGARLRIRTACSLD